jgi:putative hydrolase
MLNLRVADDFDELAELLEEQGADPFRVRAWRHGASTLRHLDRPVGELLEEGGLDALEALPAIGETLARAIRVRVLYGRIPQLERLRGDADVEELLRTAPGVGPVLAHRLHHDLEIDSLEDLEAAAWDGRLARVPGFGEKKVRAVREALATRLRRRRLQRRRAAAAAGGDGEGPGPGPRAGEPAVGELLDVDREYRRRAEAGELPTIAPRRFNPEGERWLPILHTQRGDHHYTALFSNTARAHRLGRTHDWVVIYADGGRGEHTYTVVTEHQGALKGQRVVRGREVESAS